MVVRLVRPRGGVPERLRDERAQHAGVEERRHGRAPVRPEVRVVLPTARMVTGGELPEGARSEGACHLEGRRDVSEQPRPEKMVSGASVASPVNAAGEYMYGHWPRRQGRRPVRMAVPPGDGKAAGEGCQRLRRSCQQQCDGAPHRVHEQVPGPCDRRQGCGLARAAVTGDLTGMFPRPDFSHSNSTAGMWFSHPFS